MHNKLDVQALGVAFGLVLGLFSMLMGWLAMSGWGMEYVRMASAFYIGYEPSFVGGIIGGVWGFIEGILLGTLVAWFYNKMAGNAK